jgi:signal transduction histidine kinase
MKKPQDSIKAISPGKLIIPGEPLRSEQRTEEILPRVLSRIDLLVLFIAAVVFIPNTAVVQITQKAGAITYVYWIVGTVTFLLPGAVVTGQLHRFMPANGSIYIWSHRALGPLWGFFAGFCAWVPGVLVLLLTGNFIRTQLQGIGTQLSPTGGIWFNQPWQTGLLLIIVVGLIAALSLLPLHQVMRVTKVIVLLYGVGILIVGLAGLVWIIQGHAMQFSLLKSGSPYAGVQHVALYGVIVLALLGVEIPLHMGAETRHPQAARLFLRWGPLLALLAYMMSTFGVAAVVPPASAGNTNSTLIAVGMVFGVPLSIVVACFFISFFVITGVVYNLTFARILFVAALDHRLPASLARVNRNAVPYMASNTQLFLVLIITIVLYFLGPILYPNKNFCEPVFLIIEATTTVIWCISMIVLFLDLPILLHRLRTQLAQTRGMLIAPTWVLYLCSILGGLASLLGIWATLSSSWSEALFSDTRWAAINTAAVLTTLAFGLLGAAYPRLLSNLNEQTAAARENARLYQELQVTHARLKELDQMKDAFLTTASHELRTPLTIVQGYLELLRDMDDVSPEVRHAFLERACRACEELVVLQANIIDASRVSFDAATLELGNILFNIICANVVDLFEPWLLKEKRVIELEMPPHLIVRADEARLKQVLHNLITNALRYSPPGTPVRITAIADETTGLVTVRIIDRGPGVPPDKRDVIFEKFVRLGRDMLGDIRGSGLGLYIARQLIEAMQGTITVESSGIFNEGSTFVFTLPLVVPVSELEQPADSPETEYPLTLADE